MAYLNGLLGAVSKPTGVWMSIISAFEGAVGNYILGFILMTVIVKLIWSGIELLTKWNQRKMSAMNALMQPELDKVAQKYKNQPQVLQQKQNEIRKKYSGKTQAGSCIIMLVTMALNMLIFFSLFSGLNGMSAYKAGVAYEESKFAYANCLSLTDQYFETNPAQAMDYFSRYEHISFKFIEEDNLDNEGNPGQDGINEKYVVLAFKDVEIARDLYKTDFAGGQKQKVNEDGSLAFEEDGITPIMVDKTSNDNICQLIEKYYPVDEEGKPDSTKDVILKQEGEVTLYRLEAIQKAIMPAVSEAYNQNKEGFLWIKNVWASDSSMSNPIPDYNSVASGIGADNLQEGEELIYSFSLGYLRVTEGGSNGYFILPILCIAVAFLTNILNEKYNMYKYKKDIKKGKNVGIPQKSGKIAKILMPTVFGLFALLYNSVFALYMLVGQIVSMVLLFPQMLLVDAIIEKREKKKVEKEVITVDYSRKF